MNRPQMWTLSILALAVIALATIAVFSSRPEHEYSQCQNGHTKEKDCSAYEMPFGFLIRAGTFFDAHNGAFSALSGIAVAVFTFTLWQVTTRLYITGERQIEIAARQIDLAQRQHVATHRPKIVIRRPYFTHFEETMIYTCRFQIVNVGASDAKIVLNTLIFSVYPKSYSPIVLPYPPYSTQKSLEGIALKSGQTIDISTDSPVKGEIIEAEALDTSLPPDKLRSVLVFYGSIIYSDEYGVNRRTAFWRVWNNETRSFKTSEDPEVEFQD